MLARALDIIFPPQCLVCRQLVPSHGALCLPCWQAIPFITDPMCACCGLPFAFKIGDEALCGECLKERPAFSQARSVFVYDDASRTLITQLKFADQLHLAAIYGNWLAKAGQPLVKGSDVIVPVPLSWRRFIRRRYNQSALLASALSKQTGLPALPDALLRRRHTPPQTGLTRKQRYDNVKGAFAVNPKRLSKIKGINVLLIDDVMTTGVTLNECAATLIKSGAASVQVLTMARTI